MFDFLERRLQELVKAYTGCSELAACSVKVEDLVRTQFSLRDLFPHPLMDFIGDADQTFPFYNDLDDHLQMCQDFLKTYLNPFVQAKGIIQQGEWLVVPRGSIGKHRAEIHGDVHLRKLGYTTDINGQFVVVDLLARRGMINELRALGCPMKVIEAGRLDKTLHAYVLLHKKARDELNRTFNKGLYLYSPDTKELFDKFWK